MELLIKENGDTKMKNKAGFRLGVYVFKDAEVIDYAAPYGVFSVARRLDPELEAFLVADSHKPVQPKPA